MENEYIEKKSLRTLFEKRQKKWNELAKDCVCFANAKGGKIYIGIEDDDEMPPKSQVIEENSINLIRKRISELTINVGVIVSKRTALNGGEYIEVEIKPSQQSVAATTDGRYYIRMADACKPVFVWETKVVQKITTEQCDREKLHQFIKDIKSSERVSNFVKQKSEEELLSHYQMYNGQYLTNLGILWIGTRQQRAQLHYAPVVQFIKYDKNGNKIKKEIWDDFTLNPKELIQSIWDRIPEWKEGIEISKGLFGRPILYHYNENIIRELLANALVHRPYTTRGDIFINHFPDYIEIHNPGLLPLGVTPNNILHQSVRRNEHLSKVFYDLNLMEREGGGYDKIYEILVSEAKQLPIVEEKDDRVIVSVFNTLINKDIIQIIENITY